MMHDELVKKLDEITLKYFNHDKQKFKELLLKIWVDEMGYIPNLIEPQTYNEKLLDIYLNYDQNKILNIVDKIEFKKWLINKGFKEYIVPTYAIYENINEMTLEDLTKIKKPYIIKLSNSTENEDMFIIRENTSQTELKKIINHFYEVHKRYLNQKNQVRNFYETWCYGKIKPRIIIEPLLGENTLVDDFKIFNFKDKQFCLYMNKTEIEKNSWDWKLLKSNIYDLENNQSILDQEKINFNFKKISLITKQISLLFTDLKHIRVDFYFVDSKIYIGEITFNTANAFFTFWDHPKWKSKDIEWGKYWK